MRADLNKQLCERERRGHTRRYKEVRRNKKYTDPGVEGENLPSQEGIKHRYGYETKEFNENLNPLWGQIRKAVGRPWAKFYSELCQNFDKRSVINQHILQHLYDRLCVKVVVKNGELWVHPRYGDPQPLKGDVNIEYYVDPRDGIIKKNKAYKSYRQIGKEAAEIRAKKEAEVTKWIDEDHVLRNINGVWFIFEVKDIPVGHMTYTKPPGKNLFAIYSYEGEGRPWEKLRDYEREKVGVPIFVGDSAHDVFYNERVYRDGRSTRALFQRRDGHRRPHNELVNARKYHATKRAASHKILKQAGLAA